MRRSTVASEAVSDIREMPEDDLAVVRGGSTVEGRLRARGGPYTYEGSPVVTYNIINAWPK